MSNRLVADFLAAALAVTLPLYALSAGDSGHPLLQVALILGGSVLVYETLAELLDRLLDP